MSHHHSHQNRNHSRQADAAKCEAPPLPLPPGPETDPIFAASEAVLLVPGDKAKLDTAVQPGNNVSQLTNDAGYLTSPLTQALDTGTNDLTCNGFLVGNLSLISLPSGQLLLDPAAPTVVLDWFQQKLLGTWTADALHDNGGNPYLTNTAAQNVLAAPVAAPSLANGQLGFSIDEAGHNLVITVQYSDGTLKSATLPLS